MGTVGITRRSAVTQGGQVTNLNAKSVDGGVDYFLSSTRFAIEMVCAKQTEREKRKNCLKMIANLALELQYNGMPQLLFSLIGFCSEIDVALADRNASVRNAAVLKLINLDLMSLSVTQRMDIVRLLVFNKDSGCKMLNTRLFDKWLTMANHADDSASKKEPQKLSPLKLLYFLEPVEEEEVSRRFMNQLLTHCRELMLLTKVHLYKFVKVIIGQGDCFVVCSQNYKELLNKNSLSPFERANAIFFWQCLLEFCQLNSCTEADWFECKYLLLPTLRTFCEFIHKFLPLEALNNISDFISYIMHRSINPNATVLSANNTISLVNDYNTLETDPNEIEKGLLCQNLKCRMLALEAMGLLAVHDRRIAFEKTILIKDALKLDEGLKVTLLDVLCNISLVHGYKNVSNWFIGNISFSHPENELIKVFVDNSENRDPEVRFTACLSLCKLMIHEVNLSWSKIFAELMLKAFQLCKKEDFKIRNCIITFLSIFAETSSDHQAMLKHSAQLVLCEKIVELILHDPDDIFMGVYCKMASEMTLFHDLRKKKERNIWIALAKRLRDRIKQLKSAKKIILPNKGTDELVVLTSNLSLNTSRINLKENVKSSQKVKKIPLLSNSQNKKISSKDNCLRVINLLQQTDMNFDENAVVAADTPKQRPFLPRNAKISSLPHF
ncbi:unnamed protein product [Dracunculus medinensis]|uniref:Cnd3 domain-containing protein n=1 Tax=Dracunculus medinensis TaxID=318479 RepID=A0A158Q593_DRAME|nr:unnamed protein product [Dracunculus medinensis]